MISDPWLKIPFDPKARLLQTLGRPNSSPYGQFNLGLNVGDDLTAVMINRERLASQFGAPVYFPNQVHGSTVVELSSINQIPKNADAVITSTTGLPVGVLTADCLPVVFSNGHRVAVAHAGWRGLVNGVLENVISAFDTSYLISAWLGPCIGLDEFEVGPEVVDEFLDKYPFSKPFIIFSDRSDRAFIDLKKIVINLLELHGLEVEGCHHACTVKHFGDWYSYRRQSVTGRMATCIMLLE